MKRRKTIKLVLVLLGGCCIIAAAALSAYNMQTASKAANEANKLTASLKDQMQYVVKDNAQLDPGLETPKGVAQAQDMPNIIIDGYDVCGSLSIPAIDVDLAVLTDWNYDLLKITACRYTGDYRDQLIVMAHNYPKHFGQLSNLKNADEVTFTAANGDEHNYQVIATETWGSYDLDEIVSGDDWDLTLFTCTYGGESRIVVRCARMEQ